MINAASTVSIGKQNESNNCGQIDASLSRIGLRSALFLLKTKPVFLNYL
jgi:hypothetical protein